MQEEIQSMLNKHAYLMHREHPGRVFLSNVLSPKKGWQAETCNKPKAVKPISED